MNSNNDMVSTPPTVLVFDSGVGGLSVYNEIRQLMPDLHFIYAFDNEGFPYGDKTDEVIIQRVSTFIDKINQQYPIDIAVIACNTASTICLPILREQFEFPIVGVVPAIKPATKETKNGHVGLLATKATVRRSYTAELIKQFASDCHIELLGLSELALMAEDKLHGQPVDIQKLTTLLEPWTTLPIIPDTIVLGCTHYPFLKPELQIVFPKAIFIDSGHAIACRVAFLLKEKLSNKGDKLFEKTDNIAINSSNDEKVTKLTAILEQYNLSKFQIVKLDFD